ncbi:MAG: peptide-methionine (R)-S-oxide reductase [Candidatus Colwellbacteria bacterium RIFCSPLOWO2_01_FULL_48_10]|uniref:peptide-methionine (R)-S-oxide reductase n=1 Tax=Candidatus Colwellbacteria bacterium RIFCSPLOWO2_01_FULL_48_10 TaxID=1797690 RepID=A0A1G1Z4K6_9BACT|nr:MAG: peptide-methionine (R)-S-oxide reductase [Candidatus Colwellbacteria bacterium RIFCSPLOWO2_01_FULL_48_10]
MNPKKDLEPTLKHVALENGTEAPFSGKYFKETARGTYNCAVCANPLFASDTKFETKIPGLMGWPSFDDAISGSIELRPDDSDGMQRTEVVCKNCKAHLGHVFDDKSETKTGKHYCINSVCLNLEKDNA